MCVCVRCWAGCRYLEGGVISECGGWCFLAQSITWPERLEGRERSLHSISIKYLHYDVRREWSRLNYLLELTQSVLWISSPIECCPRTATQGTLTDVPTFQCPWSSMSPPDPFIRDFVVYLRSSMEKHLGPQASSESCPVGTHRRSHSPHTFPSVFLLLHG
jgi:hypothetical protein